MRAPSKTGGGREEGGRGLVVGDGAGRIRWGRILQKAPIVQISPEPLKGVRALPAALIKMGCDL